MRFRISISVFLTSSVIAGALGAESQLKLDALLSRLLEKKTAYDKSLPDFICNEHIVEEYVQHGRLTEKLTADSVFRVQRKSGKGTEFQFVETRTIRMRNGKPSTAKKLVGPFTFSGGVTDALYVLTSGALKCTTFRLKPRKDFGPPETELGLAFETVPRPELTGWCGPDKLDGAGELRVDAETLDPAYVEMRSPLRKPENHIMTVSVRYSNASLGGNDYWIPSQVKAEITNPQVSDSRRVYTATYSHYEKFDSRTSVTYEEP